MVDSDFLFISSGTYHKCLDFYGSNFLSAKLPALVRTFLTAILRKFLLFQGALMEVCFWETQPAVYPA